MCNFKLILETKLLSQKKHLNDFFPSWIDSKCLFKVPLREKPFSQNEHLNGFFPSCTDSMWAFKLLNYENSWPRIEQLCSFFSSLWIDLICFFKLPLAVKIASQIKHLYDFFTWWTETICCLKSFGSRQLYLHKGQDFLPSWIDSTWFFKVHLFGKVLS